MQTPYTQCLRPRYDRYVYLLYDGGDSLLINTFFRLTFKNLIISPPISLYSNQIYLLPKKKLTLYHPIGEVTAARCW